MLFMTFVATISLTEDDRQYIKDHDISLTNFVRTNIKKLKETHSPEQVSISKKETIV